MAALLALSVTPSSQAASSLVTEYTHLTVKLTNLQRTLHNVSTLKRNDCLQKMAQAQAVRMARQERMFHQDLAKVQHQCDVGWAGENVAYGYLPGIDVLRAWMQSPGHRANILKKQYRLIGVGAVKAHGVWWVAQVFGTRA